MDYYEEYLRIHPDFPKKIQCLPNEISKRFIKQLSAPTITKLNFLSTLSEIKFGISLINRGFTVEYNKTIQTLTPDWYFEHNNDRYAVEVRRINSSIQSIVIDELYDYINLKFAHCKPAYVVSVASKITNSQPFGSNELLITQLLIDQIDLQKQQIESYLLNPNPDSQLDILLNYQDKQIGTITIELRPFQLVNRKNLICLRGADPIKWRIDTVVTAIKEKAERYQNLIQQEDLKFFIGLDIAFDTAVTPEEVFTEMVGIPSYSTYDSYRKLGAFYTAESLSDVEGILIFLNSHDPVLISNPCRQKLLKEHFTELLHGR